MIRYYTVRGDLRNGYDFEYTFRFAKDAEAKYDTLTHSGIAYRSLSVFDDKEGDIILRREDRGYGQDVPGGRFWEPGGVDGGIGPDVNCYEISPDPELPFN